MGVKVKMSKLRMAIGYGATCAGCDFSILDFDEKIEALSEKIEIVFWPIAMDFKEKDLESFPDGHIDISLFHGPIRTEAHAHMAHLLRKKSKILIAFGSCACFGGIPALADLWNREEIFKVIYKTTPTTENPNGILPKKEISVDGVKLTLPEFYDYAVPLDSIVDVDYYVPGCPPEIELMEKVLNAIDEYVKYHKLPPKGYVFAGDTTLCEECGREKPDVIVVKKFYRPYEIIPDPNKCLLAQGIICLGPVTRSGCGAKCTKANIGCRGCMGPTDKIIDPGAKALSYIASIAGADSEPELGEEGLSKILESIVDPLGTFYRFTLPLSPYVKVSRRLNHNGEENKK